MKFYVKLALVVAIFAAILFYLSENEGTSPVPAPQASASGPAALAPAEAVAPMPQVAAPQQAVTRIAPVAASSAGSQHAAQLQRAAQSTRVQLVGLAPVNDWLAVTVCGPSHVECQAFLDEALRQGLRDVDYKRTNLQKVVQNGRGVTQTTYYVRF